MNGSIPVNEEKEFCNCNRHYGLRAKNKEIVNEPCLPAGPCRSRGKAKVHWIRIVIKLYIAGEL